MNGSGLARRNSHAIERLVWRRGQFYLDAVAGVYLATGQDDAHDSSFANDITLLVVADKLLEKAGLKLIQLVARVSQTGHLDHRRISHMQPGAFRQAKQIDAARGHILTQLSGRHGESSGAQIGMQFGMNQVYLAQVRLARVLSHSRSVLHRGAHVSVALHAEPGQ